MTFLRISAAFTALFAFAVLAPDASAVSFSDTTGVGITTFDTEPIVFNFPGVPLNNGNPGTIRIEARGDIGLPALSETLDIEIDNGVDPGIMFGFVFSSTTQAGIDTDDREGDQTKPIPIGDLTVLTSTGNMNVTISFDNQAGGIDERFANDFLTATIEYSTGPPPATPEPSSVGLGALGLLLFSITPRRRRRRA